MAKEFSSIPELVDYVIANKPNGGIIALTGYIGAGKNYVGFSLGNELVNLGYNITIQSFASPLKRLVTIIFGLLKNGKQLEGEYPKGYDEFEYEVMTIYPDIEKGSLINIYTELVTVYNNQELTDKQKVRFMLQKIGDGLRGAINDDIWCMHLGNRLSGVLRANDDYGTEIHYAIVTDMRYPNEKLYLKKVDSGLLVVKVIAPEQIILKRLNIDKHSYRKMLEHRSESSINEITPDIIYTNIN